jgi:hypothetical protein
MRAAGNPRFDVLIAMAIADRLHDYSIFDSSVYRNHTAKWIFLQEKATFHVVLMSKFESTML